MDAALAAATAAAEASDAGGEEQGPAGRGEAGNRSAMDTVMAADAAVAVGTASDSGSGSAAVVTPGLRKAAVLVALFEGRQGELRVWLTRRASKLSTHAGKAGGGRMRWREESSAE